MLRTGITLILLLVATGAFAQPATSQPANQPSAEQRLEDLISIIVGQNPLEVRIAIARELLLQDWPQTPARLAGILNNHDPLAKVAVTRALIDLPQFLDDVYIEPLVVMLGDANDQVREAAAVALTAYDNHGVISRLRTLALDAQQPARARRGALAALGLSVERDAVRALAEALDADDASVASAALAALERATAMDFAGDAAAARQWWTESETLPLERWQQLQIERLVRANRMNRDRLTQLEQHLERVLRTNFLRAADAERVRLLDSYLNDVQPSIRLMGLRFVQAHLAEGRPLDTLPAELVARIERLTTTTDPREQAAAIRTLASFRREQDAVRFIELLEQARNPAVRLALINGLGYVGDGQATKTLLALLPEAAGDEKMEAVAALGRLAERDALHAEQTDAVVNALNAAFKAATPDEVVLRERTLWAMANINDPRFGSAFAAGLDANEAVVVRQAAVNGIARLNTPELADALVTATRDDAAGVRRAAVETLGKLGRTDRHLQALWARLAADSEPDDAIRQAAWRGVLRLIEQRSADEIEAWIARLPEDGPVQGARRLELLQRLLRIVSDSDAANQSRIGRIHARIAAQYRALDEPADALQAYARALESLRTNLPDAERDTAMEFLRYSLASQRYDATVADVLRGANPHLKPGAIWEVISTEVQTQARGGDTAQALSSLAAIQAHPPVDWPPEITDEITALAETLRGEATPEAQPSATQPAPASQPSE